MSRIFEFIARQVICCRRTQEGMEFGHLKLNSHLVHADFLFSFSNNIFAVGFDPLLSV